MSAATHHGQTPYYFVPAPSRHPIMAAIGLFFVILGAGQWVNGHGWGAYSLFGGLLWLAFVLQAWFREAIGESEGGLYGSRIDVSFRWSMSWFIFSEVMFFAAFFGALWWTRAHSVPNLGDLENALLWPDLRPSGRASRPAPPPRRPASSSPSRPWVRSGCRPSTPRCCSPPA
jgi:cytochrome c oxidase subunit 3